MVASLIMLNLYDKIPPESIPIIKDKLNKKDKVGLAKIIIKLPLLRLLNIDTVFWIGTVILGIFGVGRFMIGDKLIAILKIVLLSISYLIMLAGTIISKYETLTLISITLLIIGYVGLLMVAIWWVIDIFLIKQKAKRKNLDKVLMAFKS